MECLLRLSSFLVFRFGRGCQRVRLEVDLELRIDSAGCSKQAAWIFGLGVFGWLMNVCPGVLIGVLRFVDFFLGLRARLIFQRR